MNPEINTILFDLDGTLLPMDMDVFTNTYFKDLIKFAHEKGYDRSIDLVSTIWAGTKAMALNNGSKTNEEAFWNKYSEITGHKTEEDKPLFDEFYATLFEDAKNYVGFNEESARLVKDLKAAGYRVVLATNPIFPAVATDKRINWAGLDKNEFLKVTVYENCHYAKPNPEYYRELLDELGLKPEQCLMVGNDAVEDSSALKLGIDFYLLTDCLVNTTGVDIETFNNGDFGKLRAYIGI